MFATIAFVVGLKNVDHPYQAVYETMDLRFYSETLERGGRLLPHLLPLAVQKDFTVAHIRLALAKIAEYVQQK